jgi:hypothetical protein
MAILWIYFLSVLDVLEALGQTGHQLRGSRPPGGGRIVKPNLTKQINGRLGKDEISNNDFHLLKLVGYIPGCRACCD